jgi:hypothetical protein
LREPIEAARFEFLRGATFLRELFLVLLVFFLVAMTQVYHCGSAHSSDGRWPPRVIG